MSAQPDTPVPRGRHAPPLEVRLTVQRRRLFAAAATVFARDGYAAGSAEAIAREAGMSKATFYEHFANKEGCIVALFDEAATEILRAMDAGTPGEHDDYEERVAAGFRAFLSVLTAYPAQAQTLLVEIIGVGPAAAQRRDEVLDAFASYVYEDNAEHAPRHGWPTFASREDAFAVVGAAVELVSRALRTGSAVDGLEAVMTRVMLGLLERGAAEA